MADEEEARGMTVARARLANGDVPAQLRPIRKDGWTTARRRKFMETLAATCNVTEAARAAKKSSSSAYEQKRRDPAFAREWAQALSIGYAELEALLLRQTLFGSEQEDILLDSEGAVKSRKIRRGVATTTPRPVPLVRALMARGGDVVVTRGRTGDNVAHLAPDFLARMMKHYGGTRLGRQELDGELIEEIAGALWSRALIERCRVAHVPGAADAGSLLVRVVVGVDPPAGIGRDACGIVVVGLDAEGRGYVMADASVEGLGPEGWARAVAGAAAAHGADRVIAEANNGGAMVESVLRAAEAALPVRLVHATRGKVARAEPIAALYEVGRVMHLGAFPALEDQLCGFVSGGGYQGPGRSPDRADALIWALSEIMLAQRGEARVRGM